MPPAKKPAKPVTKPSPLGQALNVARQGATKASNVISMAARKAAARVPSQIINMSMQAFERRKLNKYLKKLELFSGVEKARTLPELQQLARLALRAKLSPEELLGIMKVESKEKYLMQLIQQENFKEVQRILMIERKRLKGAA